MMNKKNSSQIAASGDAMNPAVLDCSRHLYSSQGPRSFEGGQVAIKKIFEGAQKIALLGHIHPDGDCLGSMLGLGSLLQKQGKKVSYFTPTQPSKIFDFLPGIKKVKTNFDHGKYDVLVFVDFSEAKRFFVDVSETKLKNYLDQTHIVVIDHHLADEPKHALVIKNVDSMSTAEIVFEYAYSRWPKLFDAQIATYLYMGLTMDSGNFVYDIDHERILRNALHLVQLGADKALIVDNLIRKKSFEAVKFMELFLQRMKQTGDVIYSYYTDEDFEKYHIDDEEAGYGLKIIQNVAGPKLTLVFKKVAGLLRCSLRSKKVAGKLVDCNVIAHAFGGGGHKPASGFTIPAIGKLENQVKKIVNQIIEMI